MSSSGIACPSVRTAFACALVALLGCGGAATSATPTRGATAVTGREASETPPSAPSTGACPGFGHPLERDEALLADRVRVRVPAEMVVSPEGHNIMSAPTSEQRRTRLVEESGDRAFVILAQELFALANHDAAAPPESTLAPLIGMQPDDVERRSVAHTGTGELVAIGPSAYRRISGISTVLATTMEHADGSLVFVGFGFVGLEPNDFEPCRDYAESVAATLTLGPRELDLRGGERTLQGGLAVTLPPGWAGTVDVGPDFVVHRFRELVPFGATFATVGIYIGDHPDFVPAPNARRERLTLLGDESAWFVTEDEHGFYEEGLFGVGQTAVHVFTNAPDERRVAITRTIVRSLRVAERR